MPVPKIARHLILGTGTLVRPQLSRPLVKKTLWNGNLRSFAKALSSSTMGGAASRIGVAETAFAQRQAQYDLIFLAQWTQPGESQLHIEWARTSADSIRPFSSDSYYVNYLGEESEDTIKSAFGPNYERLMVVKKKYDPENFFSLNQNIKPQA